MSLDVSLRIPCRKNCSECGSCYDGWDYVYGANITHNLNKMADAAGIYYAIWRPEEIGIETASELIFILEQGIKELKSDPEKYKKFSAENGWGTYNDFIPWLDKYLKACKESPEAEIKVSR